jgi:hypothetical protein
MFDRPFRSWLRLAQNGPLPVWHVNQKFQASGPTGASGDTPPEPAGTKAQGAAMSAAATSFIRAIVMSPPSARLSRHGANVSPDSPRTAWIRRIA